MRESSQRVRAGAYREQGQRRYGAAVVAEASIVAGRPRRGDARRALTTAGPTLDSCRSHAGRSGDCLGLPRPIQSRAGHAPAPPKRRTGACWRVDDLLRSFVSRPRANCVPGSLGLKVDPQQRISRPLFKLSSWSIIRPRLRHGHQGLSQFRRQLMFAGLVRQRDDGVSVCLQHADIDAGAV